MIHVGEGTAEPYYRCRVGARESLRFLPALNVKEDEVTQALDILDKSLAEVFYS